MNAYQAIVDQLNQIVPFAVHAGVEVTEVGPGTGKAKLIEAPTTMNHIASQHAGALFTCGEAASGAALSGALGEKLLSSRPVAAEAKISYKKIAKGVITADAKTSLPANEILSTLEEVGKVVFDIDVSLKNETGDEVATMLVAWHVKTL